MAVNAFHDAGKSSTNSVENLYDLISFRLT
jgi:hypothetical protein